MKNNKVKKGLIYKATNIKNGLVYIGQTKYSLNKRKSSHYKNSYNKSSKSYWCKFYSAIREFTWDAFFWEILVECEINDLNRCEIFYISEYNSFKNGYNSTSGGSAQSRYKKPGKINSMTGYVFSKSQLENKSILTRGRLNPNFDNSIYHFYSKRNGDFYGTRYDFYKKYLLSSSGVGRIISGKSKHYADWVLGKNKSKYNEIIKIYDFYHPNHGKVSLTCNHLSIEYKLNISGINSLALGKLNFSQGWVRALDMEKYNDLFISKNKKYKFFNDELNIKFTGTQREFYTKFNLTKSSVTNLCSGKIKSFKGWVSILS